MHAFVKVRTMVKENGELVNKTVETTIGRIMFNQCVPAEVGYINRLLTKRALKEIIGHIIKETNLQKTAKFLDEIKTLGFTWAFRGGLSFNLKDIIIPDEKFTLIDSAQSQVDEIEMNYA